MIITLAAVQAICGGCVAQNGPPCIERCRACKGFVCGEKKRDGTRRYGVTKDILARAVLGMLDATLPKPVINRKPRGGVIEKRYGKIIWALRNEGRSLRGIAEMLGIAINSVRVVLGSVSK